MPTIGDFGFKNNRLPLATAQANEAASLGLVPSPLSTNENSDPRTTTPQASISSDQIAEVSATKVVTGTIGSQQVSLDIPEDGGGDVYIAAGKTDFTTTDNGFIIGIDDSDSNKVKAYFGNSTDYWYWNGSNMFISGAIAGRLLNVGDGSDGSLSVTSGTTNKSLGTIYDYSSVSITGGTLSTTDSNGIMFIRCLGDFTLGASGTISLSGKGGAGGTGRTGSDGPGTTGTNGFGAFNFDATTVRHGGEAGNENGAAPNANAGGGGGGAGLAVGTDQSGFAGEPATDGEGGVALTNQSNLTTEFAFAVWRHVYVTCGSGGGGGAVNNFAGGSAGGDGGAGGGCLVVYVGGNLNLAGTITVAGVNGSNATQGGATAGGSGGGGGGGGGMILFVVVGTITDTSTKTVTGGTGGTGAQGSNGTGYNGGAGSDGKALILQAF